MKITVAICTYGRPAQLSMALQHMERLRIPAFVDWELLVVNNDGGEETQAAALSFVGRVPLRVVREPAPGLARARNCAIQHARGDYIVWTDDDTRVDAEWVAAYAAAFERHPEAAVFGGPVRGHFAGEPPDWVQRTAPRLSGPFVLRDLGATEHPLQAGGCLPFGANYAVRMDEQRRHPYDVLLGRQAHQLGFGNEETEVIEAILRAGGAGWWLPDAVVGHIIPAARQTLSYVRAYFRAEGKYLALRTSTPLSPWRLLWRGSRAEAAFLWYRARRQPERWIDRVIAADVAWGMLAGSRSSQPQSETPSKPHSASAATAAA